MVCVLVADGQSFWLKNWTLKSLTFWAMRHSLGCGVQDFSLLVSVLRVAPDFPSDVAEPLGRAGLSFPEMSRWQGGDPW